MFGRIFGRGKDDQDQAVCAECGRTLLAGEWTQTVVDEHGDERLICSLCGQVYTGQNEPVAAAPAPANNGRMRETRSEARFEEKPEPAPVAEPPARDTHAESDAFWQALKDKDAEIESLKAELARAEAERQELAGRFARLGSAGGGGAGARLAHGRLVRAGRAHLGRDAGGVRRRDGGAARGRGRFGRAADRLAGAGRRAARRRARRARRRSSRPRRSRSRRRRGGRRRSRRGRACRGGRSRRRSRRRGRRRRGGRSARSPGGRELRSSRRQRCSRTRSPSTSSPTRCPRRKRSEDQSTGEIAAADAAAAVVAGGGALPGEPPAEEPAVPSAAEAEAAAASLTLLQRGVDLLNVSRVPRKIAETNEELGLPHVHVGFDGKTVAATFMWTMGWYSFHVDLDSGDVSMDDRGYEELTLQPNAGVRADGTVQLAPAQISRAAAQRAQAAPRRPRRRLSRRPPRPPGPPASPRRRARRPRSRRSSSASPCSASAATTRARPGSRPRRATSTGTAEP